MVRIIVTAALMVLLAVFVAFNIKFTSSISLFGVLINEVPIMAIGLLSFALGILYSLFMYLGRYIHGRTKQGLVQRDKDLAMREQELTAREAEAKHSDTARSDSPRPARHGFFRRQR